MQIIAVDNNQADLSELKRAAADASPGSVIVGFTDPLMAIKHCMDHPPDLVLSERNLKRLDGFTLMKTLRKKFPSFHGLLISDNEEWRRDTENLMLGFAQKPITAPKIREWIAKIEEET